uniref:TSP1_CCN domain-containing protein n=1 Tax=Anisakis simplex TaxID=6269 RepID=A0A0M3K1P5_ANISI
LSQSELFQYSLVELNRTFFSFKQFINSLRKGRFSCCCRLKFKRSPLKGAQCWTEWSPCTVTCHSKGMAEGYAKRWRVWNCEQELIRYVSPGNDTSAEERIAAFRSCEHEIPYCISDEDGDMTTVHNAFFLINIGLCIAFILIPNMLLSMAFTQGWPCRCREGDNTSECSVHYTRTHPPIDVDL